MCWVENLSKTPTRKHHLGIHGHSNQNLTRIAWTYFNKQWVIKWNSGRAECKQSYEQDLFDNWHVPFLRVYKKKHTVFNFQLPYSITNLKFVHFSPMLQLLENKIKIKVHSLKEKTYALFAIISVIRRKKVNTDVTVSYNEPSLSPILG